MHRSVVSGGLKIVFAMVVLVLGWLLATMVPSDSEIGGQRALSVLVRRNSLPPDGLYLNGAGHYTGRSVDSADGSTTHPLRNEESKESSGTVFGNGYNVFDPASVRPTLPDVLPKRPDSLKVQEAEVQEVKTEGEAVTEVVALVSPKKETEATPSAVVVSQNSPAPVLPTTTSSSSSSSLDSPRSALGDVAPPIVDGGWVSADDARQKERDTTIWSDEAKSSPMEFPDFSKLPTPDLSRATSPEPSSASLKKTDETVTPQSTSAVVPLSTTQESQKAVAPMELDGSASKLGKLTIDESLRFSVFPYEPTMLPVVIQPLPRTTVDPNSAGAHSPITLASAEEILSQNSISGSNRNINASETPYSGTIVTQTVNRNKGDQPELSLQPTVPVDSSKMSSQTGDSLTLLPVVSTFIPTAAMTPAEVAMRHGLSEMQYRRFFDQNHFKLDSADHFPPGTILVIPADPRQD